MVEAGSVELVLAHPTGILEALAGTFVATTGDGGTFALSSSATLGTATAVPVEATSRSIAIEGDTLSYDFSMAAAGQPLTHHLAAELERV